MAYLDDVICFHATFDKHLEGIQKLLEMVRRAGFKLSGKKCQFAKLSVRFLGHIIDNTGVRPLPEKLDIIRNIGRLLRVRMNCGDFLECVRFGEDL